MALYRFQLGCRRQLDFELREGGAQVLANGNRLAETDQTTRPVHDTLDHFVEHVQRAGWERLRTQIVQRLLRRKALDAARLLGRPVLWIDATGLIGFHQRHCDHCLVQRHGQQTRYLHHVLEAKLLGPEGVVIALDSAFIDNADAGAAQSQSAAEGKQDGALKALARLLRRITTTYPQLPFVRALDNVDACGTVLALAKQFQWSYVVTFQEGGTPALWREFQALVPLCPKNTLTQRWGDGRVQVFRWVPLDDEDSEGRSWKFNAVEWTETPTGST